MSGGASHPHDGDAGTHERWTFRVTGRVQGVGFRAFTQRAAAAAGVSGFVRNERDGSVYAEAEGGTDALRQFAVALRTGPRWSRVEDVVVGAAPRTGGVDFQVK